MTCEALLTELCERGMRLTRTDDTFRVTPAARLTPELLAELKGYKPSSWRCTLAARRPARTSWSSSAPRP